MNREKIGQSKWTVQPEICGLLCYKALSIPQLSTILKISQKTCSLDPIPTSLFVEYLDQLLPAVTAIINKSLQTGVFPSVFKEAIVIPLLKKKHHLTRTIWKTIGPSPIFHSCRKSLKNSFSLSFLFTSMLIRFSPYFSLPTTQEIVPPRK